MSRTFKVIGALVVLVLALLAGLYGYRSLMRSEERTPEGHKLLTALPASHGFEPTAMPKGPVLENRSPRGLAVDFGYKVGGIAYSYSLALSFPERSNEGKARLSVRHAARGAAAETAAESAVVRRWDEPRRAYAVAWQARFDVEPPVPSLCIKAVIGPRTDNYDLAGASLCVAQRDAGGNCHPETLACGPIRQ